MTEQVSQTPQTPQAPPGIYKKRVWLNHLGGYTYDGRTLAECQHKRICAEGKREYAVYRQSQSQSKASAHGDRGKPLVIPLWDPLPEAALRKAVNLVTRFARGEDDLQYLLAVLGLDEVVQAPQVPQAPKEETEGA